MGRILAGLLLVFLDFHLDLNGSRIGLIPDFIGYIVMGKGLLEMAAESYFFHKVKPFATGMAIYTAILYGMDLFGITVHLQGLSILLGIVSTIVSLYMTYNIVMGVKDMETQYRAQLNGASLKTAFTVLFVFSVLSYLLLIYPPLSILSMVGAFIVYIIFLVSFNRSKNLYYNLKGRMY